MSVKDILVKCGLAVGEIEPDPRLEAMAERIEESLSEWSAAVKAHSEQHSQNGRTPVQVRRVK